MTAVVVVIVLMCVYVCFVHDVFGIEVVTRFMSQCIRDTLHGRDYHFVTKDKCCVCVSHGTPTDLRENRRIYRTHFYQPQMKKDDRINKTETTSKKK